MPPPIRAGQNERLRTLGAISATPSGLKRHALVTANGTAAVVVLSSLACRAVRKRVNSAQKT